MDLNSLYEVAVKSVVYPEWKNWLSLQFQSNTRSRAPPANPPRGNNPNNNAGNNANRRPPPGKLSSSSPSSKPSQGVPINKPQRQIVVQSKVNNTYEENMIEQRYQKQISSIVTKPQTPLHYSSDISIAELNLDTDMEMSLDSLKNLEAFDF